MSLIRPALATAALMAAVLCAGCREPSHSSRSTNLPTHHAPPDGAPALAYELTGVRAELTVWLAADYVHAAVFETLNREFARSYPGVTVRMLGVPWGNIPAKLKTAVLGATAPDIVHHHAGALGAQGFAEPVDDLWSDWAAGDALGRDDAFLPGALDEVSWEGRRFGVPLDINCTLLLLNEAAYEDAKLPLPVGELTFDDLLRDLRALKRAGDRYPIGLTSNAWHSFAFVRAFGGDLLSTNGRQVQATLDTPAVEQAVAFLGTLAKEGLGPLPSTREADFQDASRLFIQDKVAIVYTGPWDFRAIADEAPALRYRAIPFPRAAPQGGSVQGGGSLFMPRGARNRALAFEWMKWASSPRYARLLLDELGRHPVRRELYGDSRYQEGPLASFVRGLPHARPYKLEAFPVADQAFADAVKAVLYGDGPAPALRRAQARAQWFIDLVEGQ